MFRKKLVDGSFCPFIEGSCVEAKCKLWIKVVGKDPQSDENFDQWSCALAWMPILLIENAQRMNQVGADIESMRNAIVERMDNPVQAVRRIAR